MGNHNFSDISKTKNHNMLTVLVPYWCDRGVGIHPLTRVCCNFWAMRERKKRWEHKKGCPSLYERNNYMYVYHQYMPKFINTTIRLQLTSIYKEHKRLSLIYIHCTIAYHTYGLGVVTLPLTRVAISGQ